MLYASIDGVSSAMSSWRPYGFFEMMLDLSGVCMYTADMCYNLVCSCVIIGGYRISLSVVWAKLYCIHVRTYFHGVHIFAIFANESQTTEINTRENLSWHCFATCIRLIAISWTPKAIKNIVTLVLTCACSYTECALNRKIADMNREIKIREYFP